MIIHCNPNQVRFLLFAIVNTLDYYHYHYHYHHHHHRRRRRRRRRRRHSKEFITYE
jgi:hypothetical protein